MSLLIRVINNLWCDQDHTRQNPEGQHPFGASRDSPTSNDTDVTYDLFSSAVTVIFYGSHFVPVKKFGSGDGNLCSPYSLCMNYCMKLYWTIPNRAHWNLTFCLILGNATGMPIVAPGSLSLGLFLWASFNLLMGWASTRCVCVYQPLCPLRYCLAHCLAVRL